MFNREIMIQGLRKQNTLLSNLIVELEQKIEFDLDSFYLADEKTKLVSRNLNKLRRMLEARKSFFQNPN